MTSKDTYIWIKLGVQRSVQTIKNLFNEEGDLSYLLEEFNSIQKEEDGTDFKKEAKKHFGDIINRFQLNEDESSKFVDFAIASCQFINYKGKKLDSNVSVPLGRAINNFIRRLHANARNVCNNDIVFEEKIANIINFHIMNRFGVEVLSLENDTSAQEERGKEGSTHKPNPTYFKTIDKKYAGHFRSQDRNLSSLGQTKLMYFDKKDSGIVQLPVWELRPSVESMFESFMRYTYFNTYASLVGALSTAQQKYSIGGSYVRPDVVLHFPHVSVPIELKIIKVGNFWDLDTEEHKAIVTQILLSMLAMNSNTGFISNLVKFVRVTVTDTADSDKLSGFHINFDISEGDTNTIGKLHLSLEETMPQQLSEELKAKLESELIIGN
ncbi:hypothetical protein KGF57_000199 [Candida theae]|uniref:Uncharacterized protein n=1 Tax=Candida theae TaxID=1198502 RepID=A0AAD5BK38_9ASCO|nr:uncharacterized protein KGF57_000199 [Candida theae]KAI5968340.1 hypothetical protein KGF57_000199 [Candida theae]